MTEPDEIARRSEAMSDEEITMLPRAGKSAHLDGYVRTLLRKAQKA